MTQTLSLNCSFNYNRLYAAALASDRSDFKRPRDELSKSFRLSSEETLMQALSLRARLMLPDRGHDEEELCEDLRLIEQERRNEKEKNRDDVIFKSFKI